LADQGIGVGLLTASTSKTVGPQVNDYDLIIGTQAIIQESVQFDKLGLIIVDEQHRFGVKQRSRLLAGDKLVPHFLSMTATPIPRTLALTLYGDLAISQLQTVPTGRKPIISRLVSPEGRREAYQFIRQQIKAGRQAFVVCPLVEESTGRAKTGQLALDLEEKKAATVEYEKLRKQVFPDLQVGLIHGKLKPKEKAAVMAMFNEGKIDILVATSVIEVGIDIPNASVMMIEGADRFGLAQLHQIRGRVGRGPR
jgi:ATP-dependent DNA helicase RecG